MRRIAGFLFRSFSQGLVILGPIGVTPHMRSGFVFTSLDGLVPWVSEWAPGIGFIIVVAFITLVRLFRYPFFLWSLIVEGFSYLLEHTPGIKHLYSSVKDDGFRQVIKEIQ